MLNLCLTIIFIKGNDDQNRGDEDFSSVRPASDRQAHGNNSPERTTPSACLDPRALSLGFFYEHELLEHESLEHELLE